MKGGLIFVSVGFFLTLVGAGTADMEVVAGETAGFFTGLPLSVLGLATIIVGARRLLAPQRHD